MKKLNKKGFTIVELVIVIAVIGILSAVLIPTFSNLTDKANESAAIQEATNEYKHYIAYLAGEGEEPKKPLLFVSMTGEDVKSLVFFDGSKYTVVRDTNKDFAKTYVSGFAVDNVDYELVDNYSDLSLNVPDQNASIEVYQVKKAN